MLCWLGLWWGAERIDAAEIDASQRRLREIETRISQNYQKLRSKEARGKSLRQDLEALAGEASDLEKRIGKKAFKDVLGKYVVKPVGAPTLVPESDSRKPYSDAATDFKD